MNEIKIDLTNFTNLSDHVNGITDPNTDGQRSELFIESDQHTRLHGSGKAVEKIMRLAQNSALNVQHRNQNRKKPSHSHRRHQLSVRVEGVEGEGSLAEVNKTLSNPYHEQIILIFGVVLRKLSQDRCKSGIVCSSSKQTKTKDGVVSYFGISVVAELAEGVKNLHLGVGD